MSVRIVYQDIAAGADDDAVITAESATEFSEPSLLPFGEEQPPIATLEPNSWLLDGTREILNEQGIVFWSTEMSGADGQFAEPPEINISFSERHTSPGLFLVFDPSAGEYCSSVSIQWFRGGVSVAKSSFEPNSSKYFCNYPVEAYDSISIWLNATSLPYRYAKLTKIIFGVVREFLRDELRNVKVTAEASVISSEVAINTLDFTLDSASDVDYLFQVKQPVSAYDNNSLIGVFYVDSSTHRSHGLYDVSCIDAIGVLDESPFPAGLYSAYPAKALIEEILDGHFELEIDDSLSAAAVTGYIPDCTRREALQQVAFALCAVVDTSGSEAVRVYKDRENAPERLTLNRVYTGGSVETSAIVTEIRVTAHEYVTEETGNDTVVIDGTTYYHRTSVTSIRNPKTTASDKPNVIEIDNATLVNPENAAAVTQHIYDYYMKRDRQRVRIVMNGELPGDRVAAPTPWDTVINGYLTRMDISLSGIAVADCEIVGTDVKAVGEYEARMSGEFMSGGI